MSCYISNKPAKDLGEFSLTQQRVSIDSAPITRSFCPYFYITDGKHSVASIPKLGVILDMPKIVPDPALDIKGT